MRDTIYSNIIDFKLNDNLSDVIEVWYSEDLERIGIIRQGVNDKCRPYLDTEYGRMVLDLEADFEDLEKEILSFLDNKLAIRQQTFAFAI